MIVNLAKFVAAERPHWEQLSQRLDALAADPWRKLSLAEVSELERLYQRAAADLARLATFSAEPQARHYLEHLVARAHAEVHGAQSARVRFQPGRWLARTLPQTFRRRSRAFLFACVLVAVGTVFGGAVIAFDPEAKPVIMPFAHLQETPSERVAREREDAGKRLGDHKASFSGMLMTHNTRVTLTAMAMGMTWGLGTLVLMFYNGVILGAVAVDYILDGQTVFLLGWLMPHGVVEIPAMLVGGQAGFVLAGALLGRGQRRSVGQRLRAVAPDVVTLCFGAAAMLVWAGLVEAFLSQYHEPVIPYVAKIAFGGVELALIIWYFGRAGRTAEGER